MHKEIFKSWFFQQSPSEVWDYLTKPEFIEQWLSKTDFKPIRGHKFHFADKSGKLIYCEVLDVEPFSRLSYSWQYPSLNGAPLNSTVQWTLVAREDGTELQLKHDGFTFSQDLDAHSNGWNTCLQRFTGLLKTK